MVESATSVACSAAGDDLVAGLDFRTYEHGFSLVRQCFPLACFSDANGLAQQI